MIMYAVNLVVGASQGYDNVTRPDAKRART